VHDVTGSASFNGLRFPTSKYAPRSRDDAQSKLSYARRLRRPTEGERRDRDSRVLGPQLRRQERRPDRQPHQRGQRMNKDQVKGRAQQAKGSIKEGVGKATNNPGLRDQGSAEKAAGKAQATYGDAKQKVKNAINKA